MLIDDNPIIITNHFTIMTRYQPWLIFYMVF
jgi:hypothetical protein